MTASVLQIAIDGLLEQVKRQPNKPALIVQEQTYTYAQLDDASSRLAHWLQIKGLKKGDRLAIYLENSFEAAVSIYAALKTGAAFVVINHQIKSQKLEKIIRDAGMHIIISQQNLRSQLFSVLNTISLVQLICDAPETEYNFNEILTKTSIHYTAHHIIPLDLSALIYTSGTTGDPKGVMHTQSSMVFAIASISQYLKITAEDRILSVLPLAFSYGLYQLLISVWQGATLILEKSFNYPAQVFNRIHEEKVTVFPAIPTIYALIIAADRRSSLRFPSVTRITNAGAALPPAFIISLKSIFPAVDIYAMYGQTECNRACYLPPEYLRGDEYEKYSASVGIAIPSTELFLVNNQGQRLPPESEGFLCVRGQHLMTGYWQKPELTQQVLKKDVLTGESILHTGDWFYMDKNGFLFFKGRSDDIIKSRGEKVSPTEIEHALTAIDGISEAAVVAQEDENLGQAIIAFVTINKTDLIDRKIKKLLMDKVETYMVPKEIIIVNELPKTANGKIDKLTLRERLRQSNLNFIH
jgi:long-chain acyl-CoA synthetase